MCRYHVFSITGRAGQGRAGNTWLQAPVSSPPEWKFLQEWLVPQCTPPSSLVWMPTSHLYKLSPLITGLIKHCCCVVVVNPFPFFSLSPLVQAMNEEPALLHSVRHTECMLECALKECLSRCAGQQTPGERGGGLQTPGCMSWGTETVVMK